MVVAVALIILSWHGTSEGEGGQDERGSAAEGEPEATQDEGEPEGAEEPPGFGDGQWEVGTEVEPGTYTTQAEVKGFGDGCCVARLSDFSLELDAIIANDNIDGGAQGRIDIAASDTGVEFSGDCTWTLE